MDEEEHDGVGEVGQRVEQEESGEAARVRDVGDQPPTIPPSPMPRFIVRRCWANAACRRAAGVRREISVDWLGQKPADAGAFDREQDVRLPRLADEREEAEADRLEHEAAAEREPRADAVDQVPGEDSRREQRRRRDADDQAGRAEREPAHVVQVDDEEREHDPVPEGVDHPADLEQPHLAGQLRIEAPERPAPPRC